MQTTRGFRAPRSVSEALRVAAEPARRAADQARCQSDTSLHDDLELRPEAGSLERWLDLNA